MQWLTTEFSATWCTSPVLFNL